MSRKTTWNVFEKEEGIALTNPYGLDPTTANVNRTIAYVLRNVEEK
jgi:hypothetical protein